MPIEYPTPWEMIPGYRRTTWTVWRNVKPGLLSYSVKTIFCPGVKVRP